MDCVLQCLIIVALTTTSAYRQHGDYYEPENFNPYQYRPDDAYRIFHNPRHIDQSQRVRARSAERQNERQRMNERSIALNSEVQRVQESERKRLQTRVDDLGPRAENGSYKIVNWNSQPYPIIANRRAEIGDDLVFPGPTSSSRRFVPDIPDECKELGICAEIKNYPHDIVDSIIKELGDEVNGLNVDVLDKPQIAQRFGGGGEDNIELCNFNEQVVAPQAAQTENGDWFVILNQRDVALQGYRVEICHSESPCAENIATFYGGYGARCTQKFVQRVMTAVDVDNRKLIKDKSFRVPSCCTCLAYRT